MDNNQYVDKSMQIPPVSSAKNNTNTVSMSSTFIQKIKSRTTFILFGTTFLSLVIFFLVSRILLSLFLQFAQLGGFAAIIFGGLATIVLIIFFALINGLCIYILLRKIKFFVIGSLLFIAFFGILYAYISISSKIHYREVTSEIEQTVGKEPLVLTYSTSTPSYDSDNFLKKLEVKFSIVTTKTGEYQLDGYLTTPYDKYGSEDQDVPEADSSTKTNLQLIQNVPTDVTFSFDMNTIASVDYTGELKLILSARRMGINIETGDSLNGTFTNFPINIKDSGKSKNFVVSKERGVEEPIYTIGPFTTINPAVEIKASEIISNFTPPANWERFEAQELTFYYPAEWKPEFLTPTKESPLSVQFYAPNAQIPRGGQVLIFTKSTNPAIGHIKSFKEAHGFTIKPVNINGKNVTKIGEPGNTEFIIYPTKEGYMEFFSNAPHDLFYQILGTIKFNQ